MVKRRHPCASRVSSLHPQLFWELVLRFGITVAVFRAFLWFYRKRFIRKQFRLERINGDRFNKGQSKTHSMCLSSEAVQREADAALTLQLGL